MLIMPLGINIFYLTLTMPFVYLVIHSFTPNQSELILAMNIIEICTAMGCENILTHKCSASRIWTVAQN